MKSIAASVLAFLAVTATALAGTTGGKPKIFSAPTEVLHTGDQGTHHVQGVAYDALRDLYYLSFTTRLIAMKADGTLVASVENLTGHLGDLAFDAGSRILYGSIEYKHDAIGNNIQQTVTAPANDSATGFYVAMFRVDSLTRIGMSSDEAMRTAYLRQPVEDHLATVSDGGRTWEHRYGCSGIDGMALAPRIGKDGRLRKGRSMLYVAYGIYGDVERSDNDNQVILCYDLKDIGRSARVLSAQHLHQSGPKKPVATYFVPTGNTNFGIQNLTFDWDRGCFMAACYKGRKPNLPNYDLFAISGKGLQTVRGWHFPWGSTGLEYLGNGRYLVSHNKREAGQESTTLLLYQWSE